MSGRSDLRSPCWLLILENIGASDSMSGSFSNQPQAAWRRAVWQSVDMTTSTSDTRCEGRCRSDLCLVSLDFPKSVNSSPISRRKETNLSFIGLPKSKFLQSEHVMRWPVDSIWVSESVQKVVYASYPWSWLDCLVYPSKGRPKRTHPFLGQRFYWCSSWFHLLVYILWHVMPSHAWPFQCVSVANFSHCVP